MCTMRKGQYQAFLRKSGKRRIYIRRLSKLGMKHMLIAKRLGISPARVSQIVNGINGKVK